MPKIPQTQTPAAMARPTIYDEKMTLRRFNVRDEDWRLFSIIGGGNASHGLRLVSDHLSQHRDLVTLIMDNHDAARPMENGESSR